MNDPHVIVCAGPSRSSNQGTSRPIDGKRQHTRCRKSYICYIYTNTCLYPPFPNCDTPGISSRPNPEGKPCSIPGYTIYRYNSVQLNTRWYIRRSYQLEQTKTCTPRTDRSKPSQPPIGYNVEWANQRSGQGALGQGAISPVLPHIHMMVFTHI